MAVEEPAPAKYMYASPIADLTNARTRGGEKPLAPPCPPVTFAPGLSALHRRELAMRFRRDHEANCIKAGYRLR